VQAADQLVIRNAENLRWAILRGLDDTFRQTTATFEQRLDEVIAATRGVIEEALARRRDRSFAVRPEVDRLNSAIASLNALREELAQSSTAGLATDVSESGYLRSRTWLPIDPT
jgi:hypothetical protein